MQIHTAMAELSLLTEEFPDEAGSSMLWTLRIKLEKELEAIAQRNAHTRLQQQEVHTQPNGAVPHHDNAAAAPPHLDGADHIPEPADGPPTGQAQGQGQRGPGLPGQGASELSGLATVPEGSPCRHFRGELCRSMPWRLFVRRQPCGAYLWWWLSVCPVHGFA